MKKLILGIKLFSKCQDCSIRIEPKQSMIDESVCDFCKSKRDNIGKYAGFEDNRGHHLIFQRYFGKRVEPYCEKCRCFVIPTKRDNTTLATRCDA